ncbi:MAG: hypothetical protein J7J96_03125 [Sulfurimonas sp.]|nr:hypothetical protein [Sulfurimonas sp.]
MKKTILILVISIFFTGCLNKHGISLRYYSDCEEYYDMQGYYHKVCGKDDIISYQKIKDTASGAINYLQGEEEEPQRGNVW